MFKVLRVIKTVETFTDLATLLSSVCYTNNLMHI